MKVTIDSDEPLADVLRVLGSMYGVELTLAGAEPSSAGAARGRAARRTPPRRGTRRSRQGSDDAKTVRRWAQDNGYGVSERGGLPRAVRDAYLAAHS